MKYPNLKLKRMQGHFLMFFVSWGSSKRELVSLKHPYLMLKWKLNSFLKKIFKKVLVQNISSIQHKSYDLKEEKKHISRLIWKVKFWNLNHKNHFNLFKSYLLKQQNSLQTVSGKFTQISLQNSMFGRTFCLLALIKKIDLLFFPGT